MSRRLKLTEALQFIENQKSEIARLTAEVTDLRAKIHTMAQTIGDFSLRCEEQAKRIKEMEVLLSGRTVSCGNCPEMAKEIERLRGVVDEKSELIELNDCGHPNACVEHVQGPEDCDEVCRWCAESDADKHVAAYEKQLADVDHAHETAILEARERELAEKLDAIEKAQKAIAANHCGTGCTSCGSFWTLTSHQGKPWHYDFCPLEKLRARERELVKERDGLDAACRQMNKSHAELCDRLWAIAREQSYPGEDIADAFKRQLQDRDEQVASLQTEKSLLTKAVEDLNEQLAATKKALDREVEWLNQAMDNQRAAESRAAELQKKLDETERDARAMYAVFKDLREIVRNAGRSIGIEQVVSVFAPLRWEGKEPPAWVDPLTRYQEQVKFLADALSRRCPCWGSSDQDYYGHNRKDCPQRLALEKLAALAPRQPQAERCTHGHRDGSFCHEDLPPSEPVVLFGEPATTPYPYQDKPACFKCGAPWREHYFNSRHCFSGADGDKAYWTYTQPPSEPCRDLSHTRILNDCQTCGKKVASPQPKEDAR